MSQFLPLTPEYTDNSITSHRYENDALVRGQVATPLVCFVTKTGQTIGTIVIQTIHEHSVEYHYANLFADLVEVARNLPKGTWVSIRGRLRTRSWRDKQTLQKRTGTSIVVSELEVM